MSEQVTKPTLSEKQMCVAKELSDGIKTIESIAREYDISDRQIYRWKQNPEFMQLVDELTLTHENATRAGLLRGLYKGLAIKSKKIDDDKNTFLDFSKEIAELQNLKKQQIELKGDLNHSFDPNTLSDPDVIKAADELANSIGKSRIIRSGD